jgi:predicted RNA-binding Zn-ribbon protein involved in translation (DUF1610 family)
MSPSQILARTLAWFAVTFTTPCGHVLDVRIEGTRLECGKCGNRIEAKS